MFRKISDFEAAWDQNVKGTMAVLGALTEESLNQKVNDDHRDLARMAWHLVTTYPEMMKLTGLEVASVKEDAPVPKTLAESIAGYKGITNEVLQQVKEKWGDAEMEVEDDMYGQRWKRGMTLSDLLSHEVHHRGQMTVLMRQAGLKVPGVFGPAKEEWAQHGMKTPEI